MAQIVISEEQLASLKNEIKQELLSSGLMPQIVIRQETIWDDIKAKVIENTSHLGAHKQWQVVNAISTILRHSFQISFIKYIPEDKEAEAMRIADLILDSIVSNRKTKSA